MGSVIELLKSHRSIRKFTTQEIAADLFQDLIDAAQAAATSSFLQGSTIIRVKNPETRQQIAQQNHRTDEMPPKEFQPVQKAN